MGSSVGVVSVRAGRGNSVITFTFLLREERGFEGSPRLCYSREFMPLLHGKGETMGLCEDTGCGGEGFPFGVGLVGPVFHEESVLDAVEVGLEVQGLHMTAP